MILVLREEFAFLFQTFSRIDPPGQAPPTRGRYVFKKGKKEAKEKGKKEKEGGKKGEKKKNPGPHHLPGVVPSGALTFTSR